jgi:hypothetical protein
LAVGDWAETLRRRYVDQRVEEVTEHFREECQHAAVIQAVEQHEDEHRREPDGEQAPRGVEEFSRRVDVCIGCIAAVSRRDGRRLVEIDG